MRKIVSISAAAVLVLALTALAHADSLTSHHGQSIVLMFASGSFPGSSAVATFTLQSNKLIANTQNTATSGAFLSDISFGTVTNLSNVKSVFGNNNVRFGGNSGTNILTLSSTPSSLGFNVTIAHPATSEQSRSRDLPTDVLPESATLALFGTALAGIAAVARWRQRSENEET